MPPGSTPLPLLAVATLMLTTASLLSALVTEWNLPEQQPASDDPSPMAMQQQRKSYRGFKLLRLNPRTEAQLEWLRRLYASDTNSAPPFFQLDFWQPPSQLGALVDVTVAPNDAVAFFQELRQRQVDYLVMADDLEELIQRERRPEDDKAGAEVPFRDEDKGGEVVTDKSREMEPEYRYDRYNPLSRIEEQLSRVRELNPKLVALFEIGKSHENRSIITAKVSARQPSPDERWHPYRGNAIWIDGGIHAREWIAPATAMLLLSKLVNGYNSADVNVRYLVESIDWYITPVLNPDGYEYSHTKNRMWRKNRRPAFCKQQYFNRICCSGVDLNRNFDWFWSITGSSSDPCHETYHGPSAFSEPETRAVRDFLEEHPVKAFITLHSYSQLWLIPYGHKRRNYPEDYHTVQKPLSLRAVKALQRLYGTEYQVGSGADLLYEASGSSHDYAKGVLNVAFSFLVELRPQNTLHSTGFLLPEAEIMDTADETWEAVRVVADKTLERFVAPLVGGRQGLKGMTTTTMATGISGEAGTNKGERTSTRRSLTTAATSSSRKSSAKPTTTTTTRRTTTTTTTTEMMASSSPVTDVPADTSRHTFLPNTVNSTNNCNSTEAPPPSTSTASRLTSKSLPVATTLAPPLSVRNNVKMGGTRGGSGGKRPAGTTESGESTAAGGERPPSPTGEGGGRKTIVNVKICTGGGGKGPLLPFPSPFGGGGSSQEEGEDREERGNSGEEEERGGEGGGNGEPRSATRRLIKCRDWSSYCKWWRMHSLCSDPRVRKLCTLSCLIECQI